MKLKNSGCCRCHRTIHLFYILFTSDEIYHKNYFKLSLFLSKATRDFITVKLAFVAFSTQCLIDKLSVTAVKLIYSFMELLEIGVT